MNERKIFPLALLLFGTACSALTAFAQQTPAPGTLPVSMIASVEAKHGKEVPTIHKEDVMVSHDHDRYQTTDWVPCESQQASVELFLLIDDATTTELGLQFEDLKKFMQAAPASVAIAVGYARNGTVQIAQNLTPDHAQAAKALRLPTGLGATASPYLSVSELIKSWPQSGKCREILLISSGIDFLQPGPNDTYLQEAIDQAERAGIQVSAIYATSIGHAGHSFFLATWGQNDLSQLAEETGGEAYFLALSMPVSFAPYLEQFSDKMKNQHRLTFQAKPGNKAEFQTIRLQTEVNNAELVGQHRVWVPVSH